MAYYMADVEKLNLDQRDECRLSPNREINFDDPDAEELMKNLVQEFHMNHHDEIHISRASLPEFEKKLKIFFSEHLHDDAEIRIIKNGTGYFDVRGENNEWIRIPTNRGDVVFLPAGLYHRFTPDRKEDIVAVRMFRTNPKWEAFNKSEGADDRPIRKEYLKSIRV